MFARNRDEAIGDEADQGGAGREGQMRQEGQSADTCEIDFTQHDDLPRFAHYSSRQ
jgi:hypothetical protein